MENGQGFLAASQSPTGTFGFKSPHHSLHMCDDTAPPLKLQVQHIEMGSEDACSHRNFESRSSALSFALLSRSKFPHAARNVIQTWFVNQTFGSYQVNYSCYGAYNMFHLQGFATQRLLVYDAVINSHMFSRILPTSPLFWPHIAGAPSVVSPRSLSQGSLISVTYLETSSKSSFPVLVPCTDFKPKSSSVTCGLESTPKTKAWQLDSIRYVVAVIHRKGVCNDICFFFLAAVHVHWWQTHMHDQQPCFCSGSHLKMLAFWSCTFSQAL